MVIGSILLIKRKNKVIFGRALYLAYFFIGVAFLLLFFRPAFYTTLLILFCAGIGVAVITITVDTIFQRVTPDDLRGKLFAARGALANGVFLLSLLLVGFLIRRIEVTSLFCGYCHSRYLGIIENCSL